MNTYSLYYSIINWHYIDINYINFIILFKSQIENDRKWYHGSIIIEKEAIKIVWAAKKV